MATDAGGRTDGAVVKGHQPVNGGMAGIAGFGGRDMCGALADGDGAVMTAFASANHFAMIYRNQWYPAAGLEVTGVAVIRCQDVCG